MPLDDVKDYLLLGYQIAGHEAEDGNMLQDARDRTFALMDYGGKVWYGTDWTEEVSDALKTKLDGMNGAAMRTYWAAFPEPADAAPVTLRPLNVISARLGATKDGFHPEERAYVLNAPQAASIGIGYKQEADAWLESIVPAAPAKKKGGFGGFSLGVIVALVAVIALDRRK